MARTRFARWSYSDATNDRPERRGQSGPLRFDRVRQFLSVCEAVWLVRPSPARALLRLRQLAAGYDISDVEDRWA
jgi:hypothetical protein